MQTGRSPKLVTSLQAGTLLTLDFGYGTTTNNGNLMSQTISGTGIPTFSQNYTYDGVNRLATMTEGSMSRTYTYDAYGNRAVSGTQVGVGTPTATSAFTASNNRMTSVWASYDVAGNQLSANRSGAQWSAAYDGENKQVYFCAATTAACNETNAAAAYVYDGEGNRVQKLTAGVTETFVYDAFGRLAAEYSTGPGDAPGRYFRTTDHLGSTRLVTNAAMDVVSRRDFFPFGEQILANTTSGRNGIAEYNAAMGFPQLFTGKERGSRMGAVGGAVGDGALYGFFMHSGRPCTLCYPGAGAVGAGAVGDGVLYGFFMHSGRPCTLCYPGTKTASSTERAVLVSDGAKPANEAGFPLGKVSERTV